MTKDDKSKTTADVPAKQSGGIGRSIKSYFQFTTKKPVVPNNETNNITTSTPTKKRKKKAVDTESPTASSSGEDMASMHEKTPPPKPSTRNGSPTKTIVIKSPTKPTLPEGATNCTYACPSIGEGWTQNVVARKSSDVVDRYYFDPDGHKFRSMAEVNRYLNRHADNNTNIVNTKKVLPTAQMKTTPTTLGKKKKPSSSKKQVPSKTEKPKISILETMNNKTGQTKKPRYRIGSIVSKVFINDNTVIEQQYTGKVTTYDDKEMIYSITYEDGDQEEMSETELGKIITLKEDDTKVVVKRKKEKTVGDDKSAVAKKKRRTSSSFNTSAVDNDDADVDGDEALVGGITPRRSAKKNVTYYTKSDSEMDSDEEDSSDDERIKPRKKAKTAVAKSNKSGNGKKRIAIDSDSDEFELGPDVADDDDESIAADSEDDFDSDSSTNNNKKPASRKGGKKPAVVAKKRTKATRAIKDDDDNNNDNEDDEDGENVTESIEALCKRRFNESKPMNNPQALPADGPYVEPVGIDATDGIVEGIIGRMVQKVGHLLLATTKRDDVDREKGELNFPIKLNTACSGTDAPSIAMGMIKESLDRFCSSSQQSASTEGHGFKYEHNMSCEIEPFKQAYIGRNFPGTLLFPDITKLTEKETVVDVYGREQTIPRGNLFVAGTSCKDFSMLKSCHRKDIEDKGTSGETFLAAVEYLEQEQPSVAIFENVVNAPWDKMQEYIRGRLQLSERNTIKNIGGIKKANADKDLKFSINDDGRYVVEEVPKNIGVRAGLLVEGFVQGDDEPDNVQPLTAKAKKSNKNEFLSLGQIAKEHGINLDEDVLVMEKRARYCTHLIKLDTKEYGLPQTRNRQYLFVWKSDDPSDNLGEYFQLLMDHLKTPLLHSMEAFMLPPTHDRIRCFREALRSGPGHMVANERAKEKDFYDWKLTGVKDLAHHLNIRKRNGIEERSRWLTKWDTLGQRTAAPGLWPELVAMWNHRRMDLIDTFSALTVRDAVSRDALHHSFTWDLSQNVTRTSLRNPFTGVSGCVTPGGELLIPNKGRTMMGYEKLLLQGIPFTRLILGPETEVQLSDLAGNAMSMTVVCAAILSAICAPQLRREESKIRKVNLSTYRLSQQYDSSNGAVMPERGDLFKHKTGLSITNFTDLFSKIANDYVMDAYQSSVLCDSESSGQITRADKFFECSSCGYGISSEHTSLQQIESHQFKEVVFSGNRANPHEFEMKLRCAAPSVLILGKSWEDTIPDCRGLESYSFQLQKVDRMRGHWLLTYGAWEDHGSGRQVAEIRVELGQSGRLDQSLGVAAYVKCFAPAIRLKNPQRGVLRDVARLILKMNGKLIDIDSANWEIRAESNRVKLKIVGFDPCNSQRVQIGLSDIAANELKKHTVKNQFTKNFPKSRNSLVEYHSKWKTWPGTIVVSNDDSDLVNGTYKKLSCQHTVVLSALWRRDSSADSPALYIYIRPDILRTDLDVAVIAKTPSYLDKMEICELRDWIPENSLLEDTYVTEVDFLSWKLAPELKLVVPVPTMVVKSPILFHPQIKEIQHPPVLCVMSGLSNEAMQSILQHCADAAGTEIVKIDLVGTLGSRNAKRLSILGAPSLLKYAAEGNLPLKLSNWYQLSHPDGCAYGLCESSFPSRPQELWREVKVQGKKGTITKFERKFDAIESNEFYHKLQRRPPVFEACVDRTNGKLQISINPVVAGHQAAAHLIRRRGLGDDYIRSIGVHYCLSELSRMGEPLTKDFYVPNSDAYVETHVENLELPLYPRQAKALTRMHAIESGLVEFNEEERSEHILNGVGWCLIGRAARKNPLHGGVLGDAIGSGKTAVSIALILSGVQAARESRCVVEGKSGATLIVVPPALVQQWDDERKKFSLIKLKSIIIDSTDTLKRFSVKDICEVDMVIVPAGIIEERMKSGNSRPYTELVSRKAGSKDIPPAPMNGHKEAPSIEGTWIRNMASGPSFYVGNDAKQKHRDEQAFYGHRYSEAIKKLRQKEFSATERGVPLEWFTWNRIIVDECHECLVSTHRQEQEVNKSLEFKAQARRGAREFLGVGCTDLSTRPLRARLAVWGLTGTPLLETEARVTELANLMGGTYLTGAAHHWRREERESGRDIFLNQQEEGSKSREYRCAIQESCHTYVKQACQRNRSEALAVSLERTQKVVNMSQSDGEKFLNAIKLANLNSFSITPDQLGDYVGDALTVTASATARHTALFEIIDSIQTNKPYTKIIIFANAVYSGYSSALKALKDSGRKFANVHQNHSVMEQNEIISWFRHTDVTDDDRLRPRILLLSFDQAAGHNLQEACHNVILYDPMYSGPDAVADASVEEQALGRVMRQGQKHNVTCYRIIVKCPKGEPCLDEVIVKRNTDETILCQATSNFD